MNKNILLLQLGTVIEFIDFLLESEENLRKRLVAGSSGVTLRVRGDL